MNSNNIQDWEKRKKGRPRICTHTQNEISRLRKAGLSYRAISRRLGISQMTVYRYLKEVKKNGSML